MLGRRQASLAVTLGGLAAVALQPRPAFSIETGDKLPSKDGPEGIKYEDLVEGPGDPVEVGETVGADFVLKVAPTPNSEVKAFDSGVLQKSDGSYKITVGTGAFIRGLDLAVLGGGDMPPMKLGGTRKVLIPPELAFGEKGNGCPDSIYVPEGPCVVPPNSPVELTIQLPSAFVEDLVAGKPRRKPGEKWSPFELGATSDDLQSGGHNISILASALISIFAGSGLTLTLLRFCNGGMTADEKEPLLAA